MIVWTRGAGSKIVSRPSCETIAGARPAAVVALWPEEAVVFSALAAAGGSPGAGVAGGGCGCAPDDRAVAGPAPVGPQTQGAERALAGRTTGDRKRSRAYNQES